MMHYLMAFVTCGGICLIAQIIYDNTKLTAGHITSMFVVAGAVLDGRPWRLRRGGSHPLEPGGLCRPGPLAPQRTGPLVRVEVGGTALSALHPG